MTLANLNHELAVEREYLAQLMDRSHVATYGYCQRYLWNDIKVQKSIVRGLEFQIALITLVKLCHGRRIGLLTLESELSWLID